MRVSGFILIVVSAFAVACLMAAPVVLLSGCNAGTEAALGKSQVGWSAGLSGAGGEVTGGTVGFTRAAPVSHPYPAEQLEKGNEAVVAAQVAVANARSQSVPIPYANILPDRAVATPCPGGVCEPPVLVVTPSASGAWYNGFLD